MGVALTTRPLVIGFVLLASAIAGLRACRRPAPLPLLRPPRPPRRLPPGAGSEPGAGSSASLGQFRCGRVRLQLARQSITADGLTQEPRLQVTEQQQTRDVPGRPAA